MQGNYAGTAPYLISPEAGISKFVKVTFSQGCDLSSGDTSKIQAACDAAKGASAVIIVAGLDGGQENEGHDRDVLTWPGVQEKMITTVASCSSKPVVLVVFGGGPIDLTSMRDNNQIGAILWAGYPGQSGGDALAQIIFGDVSPSGRLPHTVYPANFANQVPETDMGMRPNGANPGRTYRFYTGPIIYPFGQGLSYTTFTFEWSNTLDIVISRDLIHSHVSKASYSPFSGPTLASSTCVVTNTGQRTSDVTVLAFMVGPDPGKNGNPMKTLFGFERVRNLAPGQKSTVTFPIAAHDLSYVNEQGQREGHSGTWSMVVENVAKEIHVI